MLTNVPTTKQRIITTYDQDRQTTEKRGKDEAGRGRSCTEQSLTRIKNEIMKGIKRDHPRLKGMCSPPMLAGQRSIQTTITQHAVTQ